ncbi:MAG TPA: fused MFS/spermidine synthase [Solirubrobacteraceae bacterium]|jgi:spermidine synthase|nr:fused MFS/spermidine synthase [Solirubrobacteraceae bacterium]
MATKTSRAQVKPPKHEEEKAPTLVPLRALAAAAVVFVAAGAVLVLEILSVRLLTPYVGLTLETTTSIIGAVLLGIALGAGIGGWIADRTNPRTLVIGLLIGGGLLALLTVPIVRWLGPSAREGGTVGALKVTFVALVPVAAVLSAISPTVAHWQLRDLKASGTVVGGLSAWATAGALVGTFGTGFVLVPLLPVSTSVLAIGILLIVVGVVLGGYTRVLRASAIVAAILATAGLGALTATASSPCDEETRYHCIRLEEVPGDASGRYLILDRDYNSYVDLSDPSNLGSFRYTRWIAEVVGPIKPHEPLRAVFVGGGGFSLPRWLQATRPGSRSNVLEVDPQLIEFDRRRLDLRTSSALRATSGDARLTMRREPTGSADFVVGDAFSGYTIPWQLMTVEWLREVRRVLRPGGIYALNMVDLRPLKLFRAEAATLLEVFRNLRMVTPAGEDGRPAGDNIELFASNGPLPPQRGKPVAHASVYDRAAIVRLVAGAAPLRDDYAPVDQLQTR